MNTEWTAEHRSNRPITHLSLISLYWLWIWIYWLYWKVLWKRVGGYDDWMNVVDVIGLPVFWSTKPTVRPSMIVFGCGENQILLCHF